MIARQTGWEALKGAAKLKHCADSKIEVALVEITNDGWRLLEGFPTLPRLLSGPTAQAGLAAAVREMKAPGLG
jgi:hypothetical protein